MKKLFFLLSLMTAVFCFAGENLSSYEVQSKKKIQAQLTHWLLENDISCQVDNDGDLIIQHDDKKYCIQIDTERHLLRFITIWDKPKGLTVPLLKQKANQFNREKIFITTSVWDNGHVINDHFMCYEGGINKSNFLKSFTLHMKVSQDWENEINKLQELTQM